MRPTRILLLVLPAVLLPGCVVQDIHDQIALSNQKLEQIDESFSKVEQANASLDKLDVQMDRLRTLDSIDTNLVEMNKRIDTLQGELDQINTHLASLRKTISNIDNTIPFLKFASDDEDEQAEETDAPHTDPAAEPTPEAAPTDPTK